MSNILSLSFPMGVSFDTLFCPGCGAKIVGQEVDYESAPCPHVDWVYLGEIGEFLFVTPTVRKQLDQFEAEAEASGEEDELLIDRLDAAWQEPTKAHIAITTRGMACGPVSSTIQLGLNFALEED